MKIDRFLERALSIAFFVWWSIGFLTLGVILGVWLTMVGAE